MIRKFDRHNSVCHVLLIRTSLVFQDTEISGVEEANMIGKIKVNCVYGPLWLQSKSLEVSVFVNMRVY